MADSSIIEGESTAVLDKQTPAPIPASRTQSVAATPTPAVPAPSATQASEALTTRRLSPMVIGVIALVVLIVGGGAAALILPNVLPPTVLPTLDYAATYSAEAAFTPSPFANSAAFATSQFTLSIPNSWSGPVDRSDEVRTRNVWRSDDGTAFFSLSLVDADVSEAQQFRQAALTYHDRFYQSDDRLSLIDETVAPDSSLRRSFRVHNPNPQDDAIASGQLDVFYLSRGSRLGVVEVYSADNAGNDIVPVFQSILDSLRIHS
jgi:hypothetical protein